MSAPAPLAVVQPFWFDRPATEAIDIAGNAERFGYSELWVGEMRTFDAFALSGAIAAVTRQVRLVVGPLPASTRDPAALALGIASVTAIGARPAHLALGASTPVVVSRWHGRPWQRTIRHMRETVDALRPLLAGERGRFSGDLVHCDGFRLVSPSPATEICIAAFGPKMLSLAAAIADRVVVNLVTPPQVSEVCRQIEAAARAVDRPPPPLVAWVPAAIDPTESVWRQLAMQLGAYVGAPGYGEMFTAAGFSEIVQLARSGVRQRDLVAAMPRGLTAAIGAIGSLHEVRSRIAAFQAAGAATVGIVPATATDPGAERLLGALIRR